MPAIFQTENTTFTKLTKIDVVKNYTMDYPEAPWIGFVVVDGKRVDYGFYETKRYAYVHTAWKVVRSYTWLRRHLPQPRYPRHLRNK